ncbi:putative ubiquitin-like protein YukD [Leifsonia sp. 563]|uniref:EsaB/YukD family protein n=1 Tax=Leifsonia sp. 563 TaxID=3156412 RepID=UPI0033954CF7
MADRHIDVSIDFNSQQLDLRVPAAVTLTRLTQLISTVLDEHGIVMPSDWHLAVKDKPLRLGPYDVVGDFPIGDGDVLAVVTRSPATSPSS